MRKRKRNEKREGGRGEREREQRDLFQNLFARLASVFLFRQRDLSLVKVKSHFASDISHTYKNGYSYYSVILIYFSSYS